MVILRVFLSGWDDNSTCEPICFAQILYLLLRCPLPQKFTILMPCAPWCWYIYLQSWVIFGGKCGWIFQHNGACGDALVVDSDGLVVASWLGERLPVTGPVRLGWSVDRSVPFVIPGDGFVLWIGHFWDRWYLPDISMLACCLFQLTVIISGHRPACWLTHADPQSLLIKYPIFHGSIKPAADGLAGELFVYKESK